MHNEKQKPTPLLYESYLALIRNSVGSKMFRNFYALVDGQKRDVIEDGVLSCAFYVSSVLLLSELIKEVHMTVTRTLEDMRESGWVEVPIDAAKPGSVVAWELKTFDDGSQHEHVGFLMSENKAISTDYQQGMVVEHELPADRKITAVYWHPKLDEQPATS
jgi:hypothetical protein